MGSGRDPFGNMAYVLLHLTFHTRQVYAPMSAVLRHGAKRKWCDLIIWNAQNISTSVSDGSTLIEAETLISGAACHLKPLLLFFATLHDVSWLMTDKSIPKRTLERKKREAEALKANMKKRKEQAKSQADSQSLNDKVDENKNG